jgi:starch synthase
MRVLFITNEVIPVYKLGGLGDVAGSLPKSLANLDIDIRLALPLHPEIKIDRHWVEVDTFTIAYKSLKRQVSVLQGFLPGTNIPLYLFHENHYLSEHTDASDNHADKYAVFSLAVSTWLVRGKTWKPQILHLNEWHTALIPVILEHKFSTKLKSLITLHNIAYQGNTSTPVIKNINLNTECQILKWDQEDNHTNILMEGMLHADAINTVSPTYAQEILTPEFGEGMERIIHSLQGKTVGILNGIDETEFNPATDRHLFQTYTAETALQAKSFNKKELYQSYFPQAKETDKLIGYIGRVASHQKGIPLIIDAIAQKRLPPENSLFIFLGTGEIEAETALHQAAKNNPNVAIITRFDEPLARQIYAAADLLFIPSQFEPCGLIQMIAMRYGSVPVAYATGGLKDTIIDGKNGFLFDQYSLDQGLATLQRALNDISDDDRRLALIQTCMANDFSWTASAKQYEQLYQNLLLEKNILTGF